MKKATRTKRDTEPRTRMRKSACQTCRFFDVELHPDVVIGECRFNPPAGRRWPRVHRDQWCGKWEWEGNYP